MFIARCLCSIGYILHGRYYGKYCIAAISQYHEVQNRLLNMPMQQNKLLAWSKLSAITAWLLPVPKILHLKLTFIFMQHSVLLGFYIFLFLGFQPKIPVENICSLSGSIGHPGELRFKGILAPWSCLFVSNWCIYQPMRQLWLEVPTSLIVELLKYFPLLCCSDT